MLQVIRRLSPFALLALLLWLRAAPAFAAQYETFVDVDTEQDLYDLLNQNEIGQTTFNTLIELMRTGVDLNTADREDLYRLPNLTYADVDAILAYRKATGHISDPASLVTAGVLTKRKAAALAAFLVAEGPARSALHFATTGDVKYQTYDVLGDPRLPTMALQGRVNTLSHLQAGAAFFVTRNRIGGVTFDPTRGRLEATAAVPELQLRKYYATWQTGDWGVIAGTYRIGFGQRLTFDTTSNLTPNGFQADDTVYRDSALVTGCRESAGDLATSPCSGQASSQYVTADYKWTDRLRGVAAGFHDLSLGPGKLQAYGFFSSQSNSIYQYEVYDPTKCSDPTNNKDPACAAPPVYVYDGSATAPQARFSYQTLPDAYEETLGGANVTYSVGDRAHVGVTGYASTVSWLIPGATLDFQEWAPVPYGGPFGAVGADAAWGRGLFDVFAEVTRSFDSMPGGGGGLGALLRSTASWKKNQVEADLRYYGPGFANPHARPISAADESNGLRAQDEAGLRLAYAGEPIGRLNVRALGDFWVTPTTGVSNLLVYEHTDYDLTDQWQAGLWLKYENKNLAVGGRNQCYSVSNQTDPNGQSIPCSGEEYQAIARAQWQPTKSLSVSVQYEHQLLDDTHYDNTFRQDASAWLIVRYKPLDELRLTLRSRYLYQDIFDPTYLEESLGSYVEAAYRFDKKYTVGVRYDLVVWMDQRSSTQQRYPNPENWFWLSLEAKF